MIAATLLATRLAVPADAHGNVSLVDRRILIEPRASLSFEGELHYHRLIGRIAADGPLTVRFMRAGTMDALIERSGTEIELNELVRCCEQGWTRYVLEVKNGTDRPVGADASATLVHDDLAVMAYGAEAGTNESILILGGIWTAVLWRATRRPVTAPLLWAAVPFVVLVVSVLAITWYGAARFGTPGPAGYLAGLAQVPIVPANPIVSGATLLLAATMFGWAFAARRWVRSGPAAGTPGWLLLGAALTGCIVLAADALASAYDVASVPVAAGLAAGLPLLAAAVLRVRTAAAT